MKKFLLAIAFVSVTNPATAEDNPFAWDNPKVADAISNVLVYSQLGIDTFDSFRAEDKSDAFRCQAIRYAVSFGANALVKALVDRERPDMSDHKSFYSMHSSGAGVASGWRLSIGVPIAISTGYFRMAANKHWPTDVITGLASGFISQKLCHKEM